MMRQTAAANDQHESCKPAGPIELNMMTRRDGTAPTDATNEEEQERNIKKARMEKEEDEDVDGEESEEDSSEDIAPVVVERKAITSDDIDISEDLVAIFGDRSHSVLLLLLFYC